MFTVVIYRATLCLEELHAIRVSASLMSACRYNSRGLTERFFFLHRSCFFRFWFFPWHSSLKIPVYVEIYLTGKLQVVMTRSFSQQIRDMLHSTFVVSSRSRVYPSMCLLSLSQAAFHSFPKSVLLRVSCCFPRRASVPSVLTAVQLSLSLLQR